VFREHVPKRTAKAVIRLERAGWTNAGKTNLHEFAYGITSQNPHFGTVPNPRAPGRIAGGSSGGSAAALAASLAEGAPRDRLGGLDPDPGSMLRGRGELLKAAVRRAARG
jgi:aspartyl-tRNA(Asn)/glutamyl-tRNA(Gln) amidotransferase subunit A